MISGYYQLKSFRFSREELDLRLRFQIMRFNVSRVILLHFSFVNSRMPQNALLFLLISEPIRVNFFSIVIYKTGSSQYREQENLVSMMYSYPCPDVINDRMMSHQLVTTTEIPLYSHSYYLEIFKDVLLANMFVTQIFHFSHFKYIQNLSQIRCRVKMHANKTFEDFGMSNIVLSLISH